MRSGILFLFCFFLSLCTYSQSGRKVKDLERKRKLALKEIESTTKLLKESKKNTANLLTRIHLISEQINSRQKLISVLNQEVSALADQEVETETEIKLLEADLEQEKKSYSKAIESFVLRKQTSNKLLFIMSGKSLSESLRRMKYLRDYSNWRTQQIVSIKNKTQELQQKKEQLVQSRENKTLLLSDRQIEHTNLKKEEEVHKQEVAVANKKQTELQALLKTKQKQADNLNAQIEKLIAQEVARQEREAKRKEEEKLRQQKNAAKNKQSREINSISKSTAEPKPIMTKESITLSSNFASNKGRLPMPVTGSARIVGRFGTHQHNQWNVKTNSSGIDIQTQSGAKARSVFGGEVSRVVAFPGYNNCIIIRHGGYYTFYGNIQQVNVTQGQKITAGQVIGTVYTDNGSSQLHFQLWKGTTKLNPEPWLKK